MPCCEFSIEKREFHTKRIVEQIVEINNEQKLLMIVTSIQNVSGYL